MAEVVLDASAVIALLRSEKGADVVSSALPGAAISAVNLSEIATWLSDAGTEKNEIRMILEGLRLQCGAFDEQDAFAAADMRKATRGKGLSFGDRACLALAKCLALPALTADRSWAELDIGVDVRLIRGQ